MYLFTVFSLVPWKTTPYHLKVSELNAELHVLYIKYKTLNELKIKVLALILFGVKG